MNIAPLLLLLARLDDVAGRLADSTGTPTDRRGADDASDASYNQAPAGGR